MVTSTLRYYDRHYEPAAGHLEYRASIMGSAKACRAEQVAVGIDNQAGKRRRPVSAVETDQRGQGPGITGGELEDRTKTPPSLDVPMPRVVPKRFPLASAMRAPTGLRPSEQLDSEQKL